MEWNRGEQLKDEIKMMWGVAESVSIGLTNDWNRLIVRIEEILDDPDDLAAFKDSIEQGGETVQGMRDRIALAKRLRIALLDEFPDAIVIDEDV